MYNHVVMKVSPWAVFRLFFCAGVVIFGMAGLALGLLERDAVGIMGGFFVGLVFGLGSGFAGWLYSVIFNYLAPIMGGIPVEVSPAETASDEKPEEDANQVINS